MKCGMMRVRVTNQGEIMVIWDEVFKVYNVEWKGMIVSSTWSRERAEGILWELQESEEG